MKLSDKILRLRTEHNLSQEKLAEISGVTKQAVQKWESGSSEPELSKLIKLAKFFNVSLDSLVFDSNIRTMEDMPAIKKIEPNYANVHPWESYSKSLDVEYVQSVEEGLDVEPYKNLISAVYNMPDCSEKDEIADTVFRIVSKAKTVNGYAYDEPSELAEILKCRKEYPISAKLPESEILKEKIHGAWVGRIAGCLLGKTVEGMRTNELIPLLKETGNYPMHRYIRESEMTEEIYEKYSFRLRGRCFADTVLCAPTDDDTNYTVLAQKIIKECGRNFTSADVGRIWLWNQPKDAYCTAERVTYLNLVNGFCPPDTAVYKNPYREWIGAQIRTDYYGYINPGDPQKAAEMAWRDASLSHIKNGIYGAMFAAAMIAGAAVTDNAKTVIQIGLAEIPCHSRLYEQITKITEMYDNGAKQKAVFDYIHAQYDEYTEHGWCHTIPNAMIVTASLLYGNGDYGKSVCMAVETGFDTDCNGATVGSVIGMMNGFDSIGNEWVRPLNGKLETSIFGIGTVSIDKLVEDTLKQLPV